MKKYQLSAYRQTKKNKLKKASEKRVEKDFQNFLKVIKFNYKKGVYNGVGESSRDEKKEVAVEQVNQNAEGFDRLLESMREIVQG